MNPRGLASPQGCPPQGEVQILFVHADLLVVDKPSGLLSVPGRGPDKQDCVIHRIQTQYPEALIVHRLDMATSGLLLLARGPVAQRQLSMAFEARQVHKRYEALVHGEVAGAPDGGWSQISLPLLTDWPNRPRQKVDFAQGKPSLTRYRPGLSDGTAAPPGKRSIAAAPISRLELEPVTGRTHQLRVHLQALGHPIVGDPLYGPPEDAATRLYLHARLLELPTLGLCFESPPQF